MLERTRETLQPFGLGWDGMHEDVEGRFFPLRTIFFLLLRGDRKEELDYIAAAMEFKKMLILLKYFTFEDFCLLSISS